MCEIYDTSSRAVIRQNCSGLMKPKRPDPGVVGEANFPRD
jgi:hypothetical protein